MKTINDYVEEMYAMKISDEIHVMGILVTCIHVNCKSYLFNDKFVGNLYAAREEVKMMIKERDEQV